MPASAEKPSLLAGIPSAVLEQVAAALDERFPSDYAALNIRDLQDGKPANVVVSDLAWRGGERSIVVFLRAQARRNRERAADKGAKRA